MKIRTGFGFDVHRLVEGRDLWLGGIKIEHSMGLLGHSDADVLIHAICDALLGAANMRDIGYHFPDTSGEFEHIDSKILLKKTVALIATKGYTVGNIDATVCAERPKLKNFIPQMQQVLSFDPANTDASLALALYAAEHFMPEEARLYALQVVEYDSDNATALSILALDGGYFASIARPFHQDRIARHWLYGEDVRSLGDLSYDSGGVMEVDSAFIWPESVVLPDKDLETVCALLTVSTGDGSES